MLQYFTSHTKGQSKIFLEAGKNVTAIDDNSSFRGNPSADGQEQTTSAVKANYNCGQDSCVNTSAAVADINYKRITADFMKYDFNGEIFNCL